MTYNEKYIIDQYSKGRTQQNIAKELGTYNTTIRRILKRNDIKLRSNSYIRRKVKHNPFKKLNKQTEYWIGLLATDGCLTRNRIILELKEDDLNHLKKYKEFLNSPVNIVSTRHRSGKVLKRIQFNNNEVYKTLQSYGVTERKSHSLKLKIPITYHVLRGIIDGDGYIRKKGSHTLSICTASKDFAKQLFEFLKKDFNPTLKSYNGLYFVNMYRKQELSDLFEKLYKDADYFLQRKYETMACRYGNVSGIHS